MKWNPEHNRKLNKSFRIDLLASPLIKILLTSFKPFGHQSCPNNYWCDSLSVKITSTAMLHLSSDTMIIRNVDVAIVKREYKSAKQGVFMRKL